VEPDPQTTRDRWGPRCGRLSAILRQRGLPWGSGGHRRLWPPRRDANVRGSGTSELLAKRAVFMVRSVLIVLAGGLWSRTRVAFGTCTAGRQPRQLDHSSQRGDRESWPSTIRDGPSQLPLTIMTS